VRNGKPPHHDQQHGDHQSEDQVETQRRLPFFVSHKAREVLVKLLVDVL
jgi:hypothetical protein